MADEGPAKMARNLYPVSSVSHKLPSHIVEAMFLNMVDWMVRDLNKFGLCALDDFLSRLVEPSLPGQISDEVMNLHSSGRLEAGQVVRGDGVSAVSDIRGDLITWLTGEEQGVEGVGKLISLVDYMIQAATQHAQAGKFNNYTLKLRTKAMAACYPGGRSHYVKHVDNPHGDGRVLTAIYYTNRNWDDANGGQLVVYSRKTGVPATISPKFDRLVLFWSDRTNPHEVKPALATRYAVTLWYLDVVERRLYLSKHAASTAVTDQRPPQHDNGAAQACGSAQSNGSTQASSSTQQQSHGGTQQEQAHGGVQQSNGSTQQQSHESTQQRSPGNVQRELLENMLQQSLLENAQQSLENKEHLFHRNTHRQFNGNSQEQQFHENAQALEQQQSYQMIEKSLQNKPPPPYGSRQQQQPHVNRQPPPYGNTQQQSHLNANIQHQQRRHNPPYVAPQLNIRPQTIHIRDLLPHQLEALIREEGQLAQNRLHNAHQQYPSDRVTQDQMQYLEMQQHLRSIGNPLTLQQIYKYSNQQSCSSDEIPLPPNNGNGHHDRIADTNYHNLLNGVGVLNDPAAGGYMLMNAGGNMSVNNPNHSQDRALQHKRNISIAQQLHSAQLGGGNRSAIVANSSNNYQSRFRDDAFDSQSLPDQRQSSQEMDNSLHSSIARQTFLKREAPEEEAASLPIEEVMLNLSVNKKPQYDMSYNAQQNDGASTSPQFGRNSSQLVSHPMHNVGLPNMANSEMQYNAGVSYPMQANMNGPPKEAYFPTESSEPGSSYPFNPNIYNISQQQPIDSASLANDRSTFPTRSPNPSFPTAATTTTEVSIDEINLDYSLPHLTASDAALALNISNCSPSNDSDRDLASLIFLTPSE